MERNTIPSAAIIARQSCHASSASSPTNIGRAAVGAVIIITVILSDAIEA